MFLEPPACSRTLGRRWPSACVSAVAPHSTWQTFQDDRTFSLAAILSCDKLVVPKVLALSFLKTQVTSVQVVSMKQKGGLSRNASEGQLLSERKKQLASK